MLLAVPAQPRSGGRGRDGRAAGPSGSHAWSCGGGGRNGHCRAAGGPRGIARREAGAGFAALLLFHHSSAANGRD